MEISSVGVLQMMMASSRPNSTVWIGNIDSRATEFQVLKLAEPHGKVVKFDFMYSKDDAGGRIPRGYAFVTYDNYVSASEAIRQLNGCQLLSKKLKAQPAVTTSHTCSSWGSKIPATLTASLNKTTDDSKTDSSKAKEQKIKAMEAKLKALSQQKNDEFNLAVPTTSSKRTKKPYDR